MPHVGEERINSSPYSYRVHRIVGNRWYPISVQCMSSICMLVVKSMGLGQINSLHSYLDSTIYWLALALGKLFFSSKSGTNSTYLMGLLRRIKRFDVLRKFLHYVFSRWDNLALTPVDLQGSLNTLIRCPLPASSSLVGRNVTWPKTPATLTLMVASPPRALTLLDQCHRASPQNNSGSKHQALKSSLFPTSEAAIALYVSLAPPPQSLPHLMKPFHWGLWNSRAVVGTPSCIPPLVRTLLPLHSL